MSSQSDYTLCMRCAANNLPQRDVCWQCGTLLPNSVGPDGYPRGYSPDPSKKKLSAAELESLLDESQTLDLTVPNKRSRPASAQAEPTEAQSPLDIAISWVQRLRNRRSEA